MSFRKLGIRIRRKLDYVGIYPPGMPVAFEVYDVDTGEPFGNVEIGGLVLEFSNGNPVATVKFFPHEISEMK